MTTAWFDCGMGASGDMMLAALLDAGAPLASVRAAIGALSTEPIEVTTTSVLRAGLAALHVQVTGPSSARSRTWADIRALLTAAPLAEPVRARALAVLERLAIAEGAVHRVPPDQIHFHEVGALDAIADVVGTCAALDALGVSRIVSSPIALGSGVSRSSHGTLPVPAPATLQLLADAGAPVRGGPEPCELCTPTAAALLAASCSSFSDLPAMRITAIGVGAGSRNIVRAPNVLRVVLGDTEDSRRYDALIIEANVDDLDARLWPDILAMLLGAGAADAWLTPIVMKKGRPAQLLTVLTARETAEELRRIVLTETSTIGLREHHVTKHELGRAWRTVHVDGVAIRVKVAWLADRQVNAQPEYEDVMAAARTLRRPVKTVLAQAIAADAEMMAANAETDKAGVAVSDRSAG